MYKEILHFWFEEVTPQQWFKKDAVFDQMIIERFSEIHKQASNCELYKWRASAQGRLAEIIILDQFSRNMFRDSPTAYAYDPLGLVLAQEAVSLQLDQELKQIERTFLYMPYMHSESLNIHEIAMKLFKENNVASNYEFEVKHRDIIKKFGRYPHRNDILDRKSTEDEIQFLTEWGSRF
jgi:uncharacterized protein (DUF924 family)